MAVIGADIVTQKLQETINAIGGVRAERAITEMLVQAGAYAQQITPIDTSNLVNSQFRKVERTGEKITGELGYGAAYALYVHRAPMKLKGQPRANFGRTREGVEFGGGSGQGNYWDPNGENMFLEKGVQEMVEQDFVEIVKRNMQL